MEIARSFPSSDVAAGVDRCGSAVYLVSGCVCVCVTETSGLVAFHRINSNSLMAISLSESTGMTNTMILPVSMQSPTFPHRHRTISRSVSIFE